MSDLSIIVLAFAVPFAAISGVCLPLLLASWAEKRFITRR